MTTSSWSEQAIITDEKIRVKYSKDYFDYSPILIEQLSDKIADGVAIPETEDELLDILKYAYSKKIPVTFRGAGTGNYGQCVPLHGGLVISLVKLDQILEIGDDYVRVQCGVKIGALEKTLRKLDKQLRLIPSTYVKSTVGGFVSGGAGGIGSITWGDIWEDDNVRGAVAYSLEEEPRRIEIGQAELENYLHSYGTTGVLTEIVLPILPREEWTQYLFEFDSMLAAMEFSEKLANDKSLNKRLLCTIDADITPYIKLLHKYISAKNSLVILEIEESQQNRVLEELAKHDGTVAKMISADMYHKTMGLSDFTYNHTTLWVMNAEPAYTYLQVAFDVEKWREQFQQVKQMFGSDFLIHVEWIRVGGVVAPAGLPIVKYAGAEQLLQMIDSLEEIGIKNFNPHTYVLDDGGRPEIMKGILDTKKRNDPLHLLNPGKITGV